MEKWHIAEGQLGTCKLKGNAFWWLMARLAGWPGPQAETHTVYLPVILREP